MFVTPVDGDVSPYFVQRQTNLNDGRDWLSMSYNPTAQVVYAFSGACANNRQFYHLDLGSGSDNPTLIGSYSSSIRSIWGSAYDHTNGVLYAVGQVNGTTTQNLYRVNPATAALTPVGDLGISVSGGNCEASGQGINGMTYDPGQDTLYAVSGNRLYTINRVTGEAIWQANLTRTNYRGLAYDYLRDQLFGVTKDGYVLELDKETGAELDVLTGQLGFGYRTSMTFIPDSDCAGATCGKAGSPPACKLCDEPLFTQVEIDQNDCEEYQIELAHHYAEIIYGNYVDSVRESIARAYSGGCLIPELPVREDFNMSYSEGEYQYTLYYYDQADNLIQTVPPRGVDVLTPTEVNQVAINRQQGTSLIPDHSLKSFNQYNSLNQLRIQYTPDNDTLQLWYDRYARPVVSQDGKQEAVNEYSYILYDPLGRTREAGTLSQTQPMSTAIANNPASLANWIGSATKLRRKRTVYDFSQNATVAALFEGGQTNVRGRITATHFEDLQNASLNFSSYYTYDPHGKLRSVIQEYPELVYLGPDHQYKQIDYRYDLRSGNINEVHYQSGKADQFFQKYEYDQDNRLIAYETSRDSVIWDIDAKYYYYEYGPLARVEIGDDQVQGTDFAYTIHGWLKGINAGTVGHSERDMGKDGFTPGDGGVFGGYTGGFSSIHKDFGRDAFGMTIGYFENDYAGIKNWTTSQDFEPAFTSGYIGTELFNGNINHTVVGLRDTLGQVITPQAYVYKFDQLNRLVELKAHRDNALDASNQWFVSTAAQVVDDYETNIGYDPNGNILSLNRNGSAVSGGLPMDDLTYTYVPGNNQLQHVDDAVSATAYDNDFDDQGTYDPQNPSFAYDSVGNLIADPAEEIAQIIWTVENKVEKIIRQPGSTLPDLEYRYDGSGNRIIKIVKPDAQEDSWQYTYYVRDMAGKIMATYGRSFVKQAGGGAACQTLVGKFPYTQGFESGIGDWIQDTNDDFDWTNQTGGTTSSSTGPSAASEGAYYMYTESSFQNHPNKTANFISPCFDLRGMGNASVAFEWHMYGSSMGTLNLQVSTDCGVTWNTICSRSGNQGNIWQNSIVNLDAYTGEIIQLRYNGTTLNSFRSDMAIDNFLLDGTAVCTQTVSAYPYDEGFEGGGIGLWTQSTTDNINWTNWTNNTPSFTTGPAAAYAGTRYLYIEASSSNNPAKVADLVSPCFVLEQLQSPQFVFRYHMLGNTMGSLEVELSTDGTNWTSLWSRSGNQGDVWHEATIDLAAYKNGPPIRLRFHGTTGTGWQSDICIDNLSLRENGPTGGDYAEYWTLGEHHLYSLSRVGILNSRDSLVGIAFNSNGFDATGQFSGKSVVDTYIYENDPEDPNVFSRGNKKYELTNQLNNVMVSLTDRKIPVDDGNGNVDFFLADIHAMSDYYAFGMPMVGRSQTRKAEPSYRFGFTGQEVDNEVYGAGNQLSFTFRPYDPRLGRFMKVDPLQSKYPQWAPYQFAGNQVIASRELEGLEPDKDHNEDEIYSGGDLPEVTVTATRIIKPLEILHEPIDNTGVNQTLPILGTPIGQAESRNWGGDVATAGGFMQLAGETIQYMPDPNVPAWVSYTEYTRPGMRYMDEPMTFIDTRVSSRLAQNGKVTIYNYTMVNGEWVKKKYSATVTLGKQGKYLINFAEKVQLVGLVASFIVADETDLSDPMFQMSAGLTGGSIIAGRVGAGALATRLNNIGLFIAALDLLVNNTAHGREGVAQVAWAEYQFRMMRYERTGDKVEQERAFRAHELWRQYTGRDKIDALRYRNGPEIGPAKRRW
ncbi:MAG: RHS repeat-associated core domain-containing protein [Bacteroidota bacterium]